MPVASPSYKSPKYLASLGVMLCVRNEPSLCWMKASTLLLPTFNSAFLKAGWIFQQGQVRESGQKKLQRRQ